MPNGNFQIKLNPEEKRQAMQAMAKAEHERKRMVRIGKVIVITISIIHIVMSVIMGVALGFVSTLAMNDLDISRPLMWTINIFTVVFNIAIAFALICGKGWARLLFMIGFGSILFVMSIVALETYSLSSGPVTLPLVVVGYSLIAGALLFASKSVAQYMYSATNR